MKKLQSKKILLGITGGIAAYKTPLLVRLLVKNGAEVKVILTESAKDFVTPLTLQVLSKNPVLSTFISEDMDNPSWNDHVKLANWADLFLIAPATANTISSMINAKCNNLLIATYLSAKCPVMIAPAMDVDMYSHSANKKNLSKLVSFGNIVLPVDEGFLASGMFGKGRMLSPELILDKVDLFFNGLRPLKNKSILITAGPTFEPIDPVRFIGNFSSGKMGFELAKVALNLGAEVKLIIGPNSLDFSSFNGKIININTSEEMFNETISNYKNADIVICAAAVSDFMPKKKSKNKIKKDDNIKSIDLISTKDILYEIGKLKQNQILIGFALETENEIKNAIEKMKRKNLDAIVLNSLKDEKSGFMVDTNKITFLANDGYKKSFKLKNKSEVAKDVFNEILLLNK